MQKLYLWSFRECFFYLTIFIIAATYAAVSTEAKIVGLIVILCFFPFVLGFCIHIVKISENKIYINSGLFSLIGIKPKTLSLEEPFDLILTGSSSSEPLLEGLILVLFPFMKQFNFLSKNDQKFYTLARVHIPKLLTILYPFIHSQTHPNHAAIENADSLKSTLHLLKEKKSLQPANKWPNILEKSGFKIVL